MRHIGACYGARSPEPLFAALARLSSHGHRALGRTVFELIGHISPGLLASPSWRALPPGLVVQRGEVGYRDALRLAQGASALLLIDAPSTGGSVFLPSKLVDYIGARRPVWGITPAGTSADLIAEWSGGHHACADPADVAGVARMLATGLDALDAGALQPGPEALAERYAAPVVAAGLKVQVARAIALAAQRRQDELR